MLKAVRLTRTLARLGYLGSCIQPDDIFRFAEMMSPGSISYRIQHHLRIEHLIFLIPVLLSGTLNPIRKMIEHIGTASFDPLYGTRTIVADNRVTRTLSFFNFDLAVHGPHTGTQN